VRLFFEEFTVCRNPSPMEMIRSGYDRICITPLCLGGGIVNGNCADVNAKHWTKRWPFPPGLGRGLATNCNLWLAGFSPLQQARVAVYLLGILPVGVARVDLDKVRVQFQCSIEHRCRISPSVIIGRELETG
jgi:hypothetical protein